MQSIDEYYRTAENCYADILVLREAWGHISFTIQQAGQAYKTLQLMWLYCPRTIEHIVQAHLDELEKRCQLMGMHAYKQYYHLQEAL
jgi:hypothetical protein